MPFQGRTDSGYPVLPFQVNDVGQDSLFSITVAEGSDVLLSGTVLGKITASGKYTAYDDGNSDGTETAVGILLNRVDPTNGDELGSLQIMGVVRSGSLYGLDAAAMADLAEHFFFV